MAGSTQALGIILKTYRRRAGISQEVLAERAGISVRTIAGLESGEGRLPRYETLRLIADALQLTEEERTAWLGGPLERSSARRIMPRALPPLIGRESELADARHLLHTDHIALLTVTGPAGVGKTHFANELTHTSADLFPGGCIWIELAQLTSSAEVIPAIARALGIRSQKKLPDIRMIAAHLQTQKWLVVLDNCEHLLGKLAPIIAEILSRCPNVLILATSRAPLRLSVEGVVLLRPLACALPGKMYTTQELTDIPAVALFLRTVRQRQPALVLTAREVEAVAAICARLDGVPLAIQLAAAHCRLFTPSEILRRLDQHLALPADDLSDLPERHRSVQATLTWSYALLSPSAQMVLQAASVFVGGVTVDVLSQICEAISLERNEIEKALLDLLELHLIERGTQRRFTLLTIVRAFALHELLTTGHKPYVLAAHQSYYLSTLRSFASMYGTQNELTYLSFCDEESANIRALLSDAALHERSVYGIRMAVALHYWWEVRGYLTEGRRWLTTFVEGAQQALDGEDRETEADLGHAYLAGGTLAYIQGDYDHALAWLDQAERIFLHGQDILGQGQALLTKGGILEKGGELDSAERHYERAITIFEGAQDQRGIGRALLRIGNIWYLRRDLPKADQWYTRALSSFLQSDDLRGASGTLANLANMALVQGDLEGAEQRYQEALQHMLLLGDKIYITRIIAQLGQVARKQQRLDDAESLSLQACALYRAMNFQFGQAEALRDLGYVYHSMHRYGSAVEAFQSSLELFHALSSQYGIASTLVGLAHTLYSTEEKLLAYQIMGTARHLFSEMGIALDSEDQALWLAMQELKIADPDRLALMSEYLVDVEQVLTKIRSVYV